MGGYKEFLLSFNESFRRATLTFFSVLISGVLHETVIVLLSVPPFIMIYYFLCAAKKKGIVDGKG